MDAERATKNIKRSNYSYKNGKVCKKSQENNRGKKKTTEAKRKAAGAEIPEKKATSRAETMEMTKKKCHWTTTRQREQQLRPPRALQRKKNQGSRDRIGCLLG